MSEPLSESKPVSSSASAVDAFFAQVSGLAKAARDYSFGAHRLEGIPGGIAAVLQLLLQRGPKSVPNIGRARSTTRQNTQILVNRMAAERWVELIENPAHKRSALIQLTEEGKKLAQSVTEREAQLHQLVNRQVTAEDLQQATDFLVRMREVISHKRRSLPELHPEASSSPEDQSIGEAATSPPQLEMGPKPEVHEQPVNLL